MRFLRILACLLLLAPWQAHAGEQIAVDAPPGVELRTEQGVYLKPFKSDRLGLESRLKQRLEKAGITVVSTAPPYFKPGYGTGFIVSRDGLVITNSHVIPAAGKPELRFQDGRVLAATLLKRDEANDLALLEPESSAERHDFTALKLGDPSSAHQGARVYSLGFPAVSLLGAQSHWAEGVIGSTQGLKGDPRFFEISVPSQPGSSGSPLFNQAGEVVGVVTSVINPQKFLAATGGKALPQNINFAIKIDRAKALLDQAARQADQTARAIDVGNPSEANRAVVLVKTLPPPDYETTARTLPLQLECSYSYRGSTLKLSALKLAFWDPALKRVVLTLQAKDLEDSPMDSVLDRVFDALKTHQDKQRQPT